jgi:hypothetical protein
MLAVCVSAPVGTIECSLDVRPGMIFRVSCVGRLPFHDQLPGEVALDFVEGPAGFDGSAWSSLDFRPAVQDDQACEEAFVALLKRNKPAKAPVLTPNRHERVGYINSQSTSALPTVPPAGAGAEDRQCLRPTPSGPDSSDHALGGLADSYEFVPHVEGF